METTRIRTVSIAQDGIKRESTGWAWWGVPAGIAGIVGNFAATHGDLSGTDAADAVAAVSRTSYHLGTVLGLVSFVCLVLAAAGWRRWGSGRGLVHQAIAPAITITATMMLFATGLRGAMAEYWPGGINADDFDYAGLYALFIHHDTAPWTAWWGVLVAAALVAFAALAGQGFARWLGVVSIVALAMPIAVMAGSGAVAGAGLVGPLWLIAFSTVVAMGRGVPRSSEGRDEAALT